MTKGHQTLLIALGLGLTASLSQAATVLDLTRNSIDKIRGQVQGTGSTGYTQNTTNSNVGVGGSSGNRYSENLLYGYTLPTLAAGQTIESFSFSFQVTRYRDFGGNDFQMDVYLLDEADPTTTGITHYYVGDTSDPADAEFVGRYANGSSGAQDLTGLTDNKTFTINTGNALTLLQSFYTGTSPNRSELYMRFNMTGIDTSDYDLDRVELNNSTSVSSFEMTVVPEPSVLALVGLAGLGLMLRRRRC